MHNQIKSTVDTEKTEKTEAMSAFESDSRSMATTCSNSLGTIVN